MIETFLFVRLGEGEVCRNVIWKLQKCYDGVGGGDVDVKPGWTFFAFFWLLFQLLLIIFAFCLCYRAKEDKFV